MPGSTETLPPQADNSATEALILPENLDLTIVRTSLESVLNKVRESYEAPSEFTQSTVIARAMGMHILLEGPPGGGKTELAKQLSEAMGLSWARVNGHPETLPSDFIGFVKEIDGQEYFVPGAVFADTLLADEYNRNSTRVRSALMQPAAEGIVNIIKNGRAVQYRLSRTFGTIAALNPNADNAGTTAVDIAETDRFGICLKTASFTNEGLAKVQTGQVNREIGAIDAQLESDTQVSVTEQELFDPRRPLTPEQRFFLMRMKWILENIKVNPDTDTLRRNFIRRLVANDTLVHSKQTLKTPEAPRMNADLRKLSLGYAVLGGPTATTIAMEEHMKPFIIPATAHRIKRRGFDMRGDAQGNIEDIIWTTYEEAKKEKVTPKVAP